MYTGLHVKYQIFLPYFSSNSICLTDFRKIFQYQIPRKLVEWKTSCSMWKDRRTDMTKLIIAFCNFAKATKCYCKTPLQRPNDKVLPSLSEHERLLTKILYYNALRFTPPSIYRHKLLWILSDGDTGLWQYILWNYFRKECWRECMKLNGRK
jgi:hypothetical protein